MTSWFGGEVPTAFIVAAALHVNGKPAVHPRSWRPVTPAAAERRRPTVDSVDGNSYI
jgi:hypothetical protein